MVVSASRFPTLGAVKAAMALVRRRTLRLRTSRDRRYTALSHTHRDVRTLNLSALSLVLSTQNSQQVRETGVR